MQIPQLSLICFAAATVIHGAFLVLAAKLWRERKTADRDIHDGVAIAITTFLFQSGNFVVEFSRSQGLGFSSVPLQAGLFVRDCALVSFPLVFSYMSLHFKTDTPVARGAVRLGSALRYVLWPWTALAIVSLLLRHLGLRPELFRDLPEFISLHLMLLYFVIFTTTGLVSRRKAVPAGVAADVRARRAGVAASVAAIALFALMLAGYWRIPVPRFRYIELASMMTSIPFTIATAYRLYQFPFMDVFVRETISGAILLAAFFGAVTLGAALPASLLMLWVAAFAMVVVYVKEPVTRWVERKFMGHEESVEEQEERIGNAIRTLTRLEDFPSEASGILQRELDAEWVEVGSAPRPGAVYRFESVSIGPRVRGRHYMSRELRIARSASLQIAAHQHQLSQQELRELTARAQMRALQAQINPHFLFNTLNVLAGLIHTNPPKAERITEELAEIFRYALDSTRREWVTLGDEVRFLESYLEIEKARFEERLEYRFEIAEEFRALKIPPMILQPIVENAVKHGISPKVEGGRVRISARQDADRLMLVVEDTGAGPASKTRQRGMGIGLTNVRERLQHVYGDGASLKLEEVKPEGTKAVLVLPQLIGARL